MNFFELVFPKSRLVPQLQKRCEARDICRRFFFGVNALDVRVLCPQRLQRVPQRFATGVKPMRVVVETHRVLNNDWLLLF